MPLTNVLDTRPEHKKPSSDSFFKINIEITAAMLDRLLHRSVVIVIDGTQTVLG
jgi:hypothetical protein